MGVKAAVLTIPNGQNAYPALVSPDFEANFDPTWWTFNMTTADGTGQTFISFDGVNDHVVLQCSSSLLISPTLVINQRFRKVWIRLANNNNDHIVALTADS